METSSIMRFAIFAYSVDFKRRNQGETFIKVIDKLWLPASPSSRDLRAFVTHTARALRVLDCPTLCSLRVMTSSQALCFALSRITTAIVCCNRLLAKTVQSAIQTRFVYGVKYIIWLFTGVGRFCGRVSICLVSLPIDYKHHSKH